MSVLATDTFTGANGSSPSAQWTKVKPAGSTIDIQSNRMRVQPATGAYANGVFAYLSGITAVSDCELLIDVYFGATIKESYPAIGVRCVGAGGVGGDGTAHTGYSVGFSTDYGSFNVNEGSTGTSLSGDVTFTYTAGATYGLRLRVVGTVISVRLWNKAGAEPAMWTWTGTASDTTPGTVLISGNNGATQAPIYVDNMTFSSVVAPVAPAIWHAGAETSVAWTILVGGVETPVLWTQVISGIEVALAWNISAPPGSDATVPTGDLHNAYGTWALAFTDDYTTDVALGSFPASSPNASRYDVYASGTDTSSYGTYSAAKTMSVSGSALKVNLHTESSVPYVGCAIVRGTDGSTYSGQTYGRYSTRMRYVHAAGADVSAYKIAFMLWPVDDMWPDHGEFDYPETDLASTSWAQANTHEANAIDVSTQFLVPVDRKVSQWHVYTIQWSPGRVEYFVDGLSIGVATSKIYDGPMRWTLQCESNIGVGKPDAAVADRVEVDWIAMWSYSAP